MKRTLPSLAALLILLLLGNPKTINAQTPIPPTPGANGVTATVRGLVVNMNETDKTASDVDIMVHIFDTADQSEKGMLHGKTGADGRYVIQDVPLVEGLGYLAMATYEDVTYQSSLQYAKVGQTEIKMDVPIYESSPDTSKVQADQVHVLIDFAEDGMEIKELYLLSNLGDHTVKEAATLPDGKKATLRFPLPQNANYVIFDTDDQGRFVKFPGGFADTAPLIPGTDTGQILVSYLVPYSSPLTYTYAATFATNNVSIILPKDSGVTVSGKGLSQPQTQTMPNNQEYVQYSSGELPVGASLEITLLGKPNLTGAAASSPQAQSTTVPLLVGGGLFGIALVGVGIWWWRRPSRDEEESDGKAEFNQLLTDIAVLDRQQQTGGLAEEEYTARRAELMERARTYLHEHDVPENVEQVPPVE